VSISAINAWPFQANQRMRRSSQIKPNNVMVENQLLIFAKNPRLGEVKSRLASSMGNEKALLAYEALLDDLARSLEKLSHVTVFHTSLDDAPELKRLFPSLWKFYPQEGHDLGMRMANAFKLAFAAGAGKSVLIGSDCPYLEPGDIQAAFENLDAHDLVLGPARDGGYWLIGLKTSRPELFAAMPWGASVVLKKTLEISEKLGLKTHLLRELPDVDTEPDWDEYRAWRQARDR
jgi:rSAM/selenodomain-associated transferase 1